ncbi:COX15/CtaA family protein [Bradyrhizobium sp. LHD-71]|uniref:COX15/CtaA family protein n=1 Tax=Bradyrhizobium sp. LHD-71 TaxID=3072141 RepID=UPI00280D8BF4|nr:COX15/CtaA family protein [Bradyrhizobium sp. LHD-71]MDQ8726110.1 COX15/CtaA family protein [Bradyrhizobium sp. LHD-71]
MPQAPGNTSQSGAAHLTGVRAWLVVVAAMIVLMILVGGATRLTESGLSIVEWKPVTGTIPPLSAEAWTDAFEAYKRIPQYQQVNRGMSLDEFKTIFWWEWSHRFLGRAIGVVFLLPFLVFLWRGGLPDRLKRRLWLIFGLGALQGAVGWWMVASGLSGRTEVSQYRLAVHLMLALSIYALIVWTLMRMTPEREERAPASATLRWTVNVMAGVVFLQLYFGALVAGLRAGRIFNTWPDIDGVFIPSAGRLFFEQPWWRNFFDNMLTVQFTHRMLAYLLLAQTLLHLGHALYVRADAVVVRGALLIVLATGLQAVLGVLTLLNSVPIDLALTHQAGAVLVLTLVLLQAERVNRRRYSDAAAAAPLAMVSGGSR